MDNLTESLNQQQLKENIDALTKNGMPANKIQEYVDKYQLGTSGDYVLKGSRAANLDQTPKAPGFFDRLLGRGSFADNRSLGDKLTGKNAPAQETGIPSFVPGQELGKAVGNSLYSIAQAVKTGSMQPIIQGGQENAANQGKITGDIINSVVTPASLLIGNPSSLVGKAAVGGGIGYASDVANNLTQGKTGGSIATPGLGTALGVSLPFATALIGKLAKATAGALSGTGQDVIQRAIDNPDAVDNAVKEFATTPEAKQSLVDRARGAISDFLHQRNVNYGESLNNLPSVKTGKQDILSSFADNLSTFGGEIQGNQLKFTDTSLTKTDQNNLRQAFSVINNWKDTSAKGLDGLRQAIGNHMDEFSAIGNSKANVVLGAVKKDLTASLSNNITGYGDMLKNYGVDTQTAKDLLSELSLKSTQAKPSTQLTAIMKLFKKDPQVTQNVYKVMGKEAGDKFLNDISGAILSDWIPAGKMGNAVRALIEGGGAVGASVLGAPLSTIGVGAAGTLAASSPRIVGKAATTAGRLIQNGGGKAIQRGATILGSKFGL